MNIKFEQTIKEAEALGGWVDYAVHYLGICDTGDEELDQLLEDLYVANESVHRVANKLSLRYDVGLFGDNR